MKQIRFTQDWREIKKGYICNYADDAAQNFVNEGYAEFVVEPQQVEQPKHPHDMPEDILKDICSPEQIDNNYFAMQTILDKLVSQTKISQYEENDLLTELNCAEHTVKGQTEKVESILLKINIPIEEFYKEVKKINTTIKRKKIDKLFAEVTPALKINNFEDNVKIFYKKQPLMYDKIGNFWFWNKQDNKWEIVDEVDVMDAIDRELGFYGATVSGSIKSSYLETFKRLGRRKMPKDAPLKWIQFKDKAFSLNSGKIYNVTPDYFFCNPIPWELGESQETPTMDRLFTEWVGEQYVPTLYELIAYCCYASYPIQVLFCLYGNGRNGKSCFLRLLTKFIGQENLCSTELDLLVGHNHNKFETAKLYKKLVCQMGETNFGILERSSLLKRLTGSDLIGFEMKGKKGFDDYSYAKIVIASNSLPSTEDTSDGFWRRWVIVDWPNQFPEGNDILRKIPEKEYNNLARKVTKILPKLLEDGMFTNQGSIEDRKKKYIMASNPFSLFINDCCIRDHKEYIKYPKLYTDYTQWLDKRKKRRITYKEFNSILTSEGFEVEKTSKREENGDWVSGKYIYGLKMKEVHSPHSPHSIICFSSHEERKGILKSEMGSIMSINEENIEENTQKIDTIHHRCSNCDDTTSSFYGKRGDPYCKTCYNARIVNGLE